VVIEFWVPGIPKPGGSKKGFPIRTGKFKLNKKTGLLQEVIRVNVVDDNSKVMNWREDVVAACLRVFHENPLRGPLRVDIYFFVTRPKSHYGTGINADVLKGSAPKYPISKPDKTKLLRSTEDALTGVLWLDDTQVVGGWVVKLFGDRPGAKIKVEEL